MSSFAGFGVISHRGLKWAPPSWPGGHRRPRVLTCRGPASVAGWFQRPACFAARGVDLGIRGLRCVLSGPLAGPARWTLSAAARLPVRFQRNDHISFSSCQMYPTFSSWLLHFEVCSKLCPHLRVLDHLKLFEMFGSDPWLLGSSVRTQGWWGVTFFCSRVVTSGPRATAPPVFFRTALVRIESPHTRSLGLAHCRALWQVLVSGSGCPPGPQACSHALATLVHGTPYAFPNRPATCPRHSFGDSGCGCAESVRVGTPPRV